MVRDGKRMYFATCEREGVKGPCDIWEGLIDGGEISAIKPVEGKLNSLSYESQVSVSCDGRQLFFASNKGNKDPSNTDIWYSNLLPDGTWDWPIKLGPHINTPGTEQGPFLTNDGKTLYFSSNGHLGFGEGDIFMSWFDSETEEWSTPINVGQPLNTPHGEQGFFLCSDGKTGYFSSNRPNGGLGSDWDIYKFTLDEQLSGDPITFVEGFVRDSVVEINVQATIQIKGQDPIQTDENGRFFLCLPANSTLDVAVALEQYDHYENVFAIPKWDNRDFYNVDILLNPIYSLVEYEQGDTTAVEKKEKEKKEKDREIVIRNERNRTEQYSHTVFFKFDSYELKPEETGKITEFLESILEKNITRVEIIGYADDIGPDTYNLKLSEERAKRLALFLMDEKSLEVDQITSKGGARSRTTARRTSTGRSTSRSTPRSKSRQKILMRKILITGADGQLGCELSAASSRYPELMLYPANRSQLDICDPLAVHRFFAEGHFDGCINCAAYTAVDRAESEPKTATAINADGVANLARAAAAHQVQLIHFSTDYVYHNQQNWPLTEAAPTNPQGVYARSKLAGETAAVNIHQHTLVIRTSWVYSTFGKNFVKTMLRLGAEGHPSMWSMTRLGARLTPETWLGLR